MGPIDLFQNEVCVNLSCAICYSYFLADLIPLSEKRIMCDFPVEPIGIFEVAGVPAPEYFLAGFDQFGTGAYGFAERVVYLLG